MFIMSITIGDRAMEIKKILKILKPVILLVPFLSYNSAFPQDGKLMIYGLNCPAAPIKECAKIFSKEKNIQIEVMAGPEVTWIDQALKDADLIFSGAEYMLTQFIQSHPTVIDSAARTSLYLRPAGILVRKGNPKSIKSL